MIVSVRRGVSVALAGVLILAAGCKELLAPFDWLSNRRERDGLIFIQAASAVNLVAAPGSAVSDVPTVIVKNRQGQGLSGITVHFEVTSGGGAITNTSARTDGNGLASCGQWVLGPGVGENKVTARLPGSGIVVFIANAQAE